MLVQGIGELALEDLAVVGEVALEDLLLLEGFLDILQVHAVELPALPHKLIFFAEI